MTAGLPVIGSAAGGAGDLIGDGGCVVDPADADGLVAAMRRFSAPEVAEAVGTTARERAALFTWRAVAARIAAALELGACEPPGPSPFLERAAAA
jgi:glycogen synthase